MGDLIVGALLRSLRKQAGRSQAEQAAALSALADRAVTRNDVSRWENEVRLPTPYWQGFYAASFENVTADDIKAAVIATRQRRRRKNHGEENAERDSVQRRDFIGAFAGLAVSLPSLSLGAVTLSAARPGRACVDPLVVNDFVSLRAALVSADSMLGPGNLVNSAEEQVANIAGLYECIEPQARARLFEIGALFAEFCGWLADDLGNFDSGKAWSAQALEWAHSSGSADIAAYILMRMSQQAQFTRRRVQASALARASIDYEARVGNSQVLAAIHQQAAHANAMDGQERTALLHMDKAYALAEATVSVDDAYALANYCTPSYVAVQRAAVLSTLGQHKRALDEYDRVMSRWPRSYHRERGLHLARRAAVAARAGLPEDALESGREALDIARATRSYRTVRELSSTVKLMQPWKTVQGVETFIRSVQSEGNVDGSA